MSDVPKPNKHQTPWRFAFPLLILTAGIALTPVSGCDLCHEEIQDTVPSPDGRRVATILLRDCGATTVEVRGVRVQDIRHWGIRTNYEVFTIKNSHNLRLSWRGTENLVIDCRCYQEDVYTKLDKAGPVQIVYQSIVPKSSRKE